MAFIIEQAGGLATNGIQPIMDIVPKTIHDRAPIYIGSRDDVNDFLACKPWTALGELRIIENMYFYKNLRI